MEDIIPLVAILSLISFAAYFTYLYYSTRHKERMALIESGQNAGIFKTTPGIYSSLKWGILLVAIGAGLGLGIFFDFT